jgi:hypothetical protein
MLAVCMMYSTYGSMLGMIPLITDSLYKSKGAMAYSVGFISFSGSCIITLLIYKGITERLGDFGVLCFYAGIAGITIVPAMLLARFFPGEDLGKEISDSARS